MMTEHLRLRLTVVMAGVAFATAMSFGGSAMAQNGGEGGDGADGDRRGGQRREITDEQRAEWTKRIEERRAEGQKRLQEQLKMSDEEFGVIHPMIQKAQSYTREEGMLAAARGFAGRGGPGGFGGGRGGDAAGGDRDRGGPQQGRPGRGGFGGGGFGGFQPELTAEGEKVRDAITALGEAMQKDEKPAGDVLKKLIANVRSSKKAHAAAMKSAQDELKSVLVAEQEATLLLMGVID